MKKLNKAVALGMAGTMALSLTACGGGSSTSTSASVNIVQEKKEKGNKAIWKNAS